MDGVIDIALWKSSRQAIMTLKLSIRKKWNPLQSLKELSFLSQGRTYSASRFRLPDPVQASQNSRKKPSQGIRIRPLALAVKTYMTRKLARDIQCLIVAFMYTLLMYL